MTRVNAVLAANPTRTMLLVTLMRDPAERGSVLEYWARTPSSQDGLSRRFSQEGGMVANGDHSYCARK